jgi:NitT/TauT family transport system ATP-binding protein
VNITSDRITRRPGDDLRGPSDAPPEKFVIAFEGVTKSFGAMTAVKDVTFRVYDIPGKGEFVGLLGPSGCGKSTILNMIAGFIRPTAGHVHMHGRPIAGPGRDRGFVFQNYGSFPHLKVWENVAFGLFLEELNRPKFPLVEILDAFAGIRFRRRRVIREEAMDWLAAVGLSPHAQKYPHQLSGGQRQRVAIARTLALRPDVILMDEPFGALDRVTRWEMQDLLVSLWKEKETTVFLITHDIPEAVYLADRIYILSRAPGTIVEEVEIPAPDLPAAEMQRTTQFSEVVHEISKKFEHSLEVGPPRAAAKS